MTPEETLREINRQVKNERINQRNNPDAERLDVSTLAGQAEAHRLVELGLARGWIKFAPPAYHGWQKGDQGK